MKARSNKTSPGAKKGLHAAGILWQMVGILGCSATAFDNFSKGSCPVLEGCPGLFHRIRSKEMNQMEPVRIFLRRSLLLTMAFVLVLFALTAILLYWGQGNRIDTPTQLSVFAFLVVFGLLQWLILGRILKGITSKYGLAEEKRGVPEKPSMPKEDPKIIQNRHRRAYLHLFTVLQREGRLMDFLAEDLSQYDDDQIGTAVREIHANCSKTITKMIGPKSVMGAAEGDEVEIEKDFDPVSIKLIGNVIGEPPFRGILRHKGWQAKAFELPTLATDSTPLIIAPAEVEIQSSKGTS
jgi:hypothetical protein